MYGVVLDTTDVFVCCPIVDVLVNAVVDVSVPEDTSKIVVCSLVRRHGAGSRCPDHDHVDELLDCGCCFPIGRRLVSDHDEVH
jgi:hypothetical protein